MDHHRSTMSMLRSTRSANYYEVPMTISPTGSTISSASSSSYEPSFASTWGPSTSSVSSSSSRLTLRRVTNPDVSVDLNASFQSNGGSHEAPQFQPSFAFDVNHLVSSLRRSSSSSSLSTSPHSSLSASGGSGGGRAVRQSGRSQPRQSSSVEQSNQYQSSADSQQHIITTADSRIEVMPVDPVLTRRVRRDALSGSENSRKQVHDSQNSIINYSLNKKKKKPIAGMPLNAYVTPTTVTNSNQYSPDIRQTTTITTRNGIEYTTEVQPRTTRVNSFYEESFTF